MAIDNKELVLQHINLSWNKGDFDEIKFILSDHFFYKTTFTDEILNGEQYIEFIKSFRVAMPDLSVEIDLSMSDESLVMTKISFFGSVVETIYGIPASDKVIAFTAISIWEISLGKIISLDTLIDLNGLERQIGMRVSPLKPLKIR